MENIIGKTNTNVLEELKKGNIKAIAEVNNDAFYNWLTEADIIEILSNTEVSRSNIDEMIHFLKNVAITEKELEVIATKCPIYLNEEYINPYITEHIKTVAVDHFCSNMDIYSNSDAIFHIPIWNITSLDDRSWTKILKALKSTGAPDFKEWLWTMVKKGEYHIPGFVKEYLVDQLYYLHRLDARQTKEFFDARNEEGLSDKYFAKVLNMSKDRSLVLKEYPETYRYIKWPNSEDAKVIINEDPTNLRLVRRQTEKLCFMALLKDKNAFKYIKKPTKSILEFMGMDVPEELKTKEYPEPKYLVTCRMDIADEGDLTYVNVINGEDMPKFMTKKIAYRTFGNLESDDEGLYVKDCMKVVPIPEEDLNVLKKYGMLNMTTGFWRFT
jgi:hypothetical protein